jgi:hypothetical protein
MGTFRSAMLWVMVAVRWRSAQREGRGVDEMQGSDGTTMRSDAEELTAKAEERHMNTSELQTVLGYLNLGLAIAHSQGVTIGHFGNSDFIGLAETVNGLLLRAITPPVVQVAPVPVAPAIAVAPAVAPASVAMTPTAPVTAAAGR